MGNDSVIYIRTDGNSKIATGHLVRCLCIANVLIKEEKKVCFLVSDNESKELLQELSSSLFPEITFPVKILEHGVYNNLETELPELASFLTSVGSHSVFGNCSKKHSVILIDSYYVTPDYLSELKKFAKTAYIDDLQMFDYDTDLIINYDVIPNSQTALYQNAYTKAEIRLLGAAYAPLREQFQNQKIILKDQVQNILITSGGSDPHGICYDLLTHFIQQNVSANFHVVIGTLFTETSVFEKMQNQHPSVKLHRNVSNMAALMKQCDIAISAAGTTLYELCALGIPAISFTMADNQIPMAKTFEEAGNIVYAGDLRRDKDQTIKKIIFSTKELTQNYTKRKSVHESMHRLVDGNGAVKIAQALCSI